MWSLILSLAEALGRPASLIRNRLEALYLALLAAYHGLLAFLEVRAAVEQIMSSQKGWLGLRYAGCRDLLKAVLARGGRIMGYEASGDEEDYPWEIYVVEFRGRIVKMFTKLKTVARNEVSWARAVKP